MSQAQLLDELMGRNRNLAPSEKKSETKWSDADVCKYFLCGFCPHELFVNTRADLGPCSKLHDENLKKSYQESTRHERMNYEEDFMRYLQKLISDVERRIKRGHQRLNLGERQNQQVSQNAATGREDKVQLLTERINDLVEEAEQLGCEGKVEEAQGVMKLCDQLKEERKQLESSLDQPIPQLKEMEVCDVCGAFLIVGDAKQRAEEHLMGKQHMGFAKVRQAVEELKGRQVKKETDREERWRVEREEREKEREKEREERRKKREEREKERKKTRKRSRSRSRDRRRSRSRDRRRSRSRDHDRRRSRSRDRHRRRRSRSRDRRSRSGSRDRRRYRRSRSRSGSRDRERGSRDRGSRDRSSRVNSRDRRDSSRDGERNSSRGRERSHDGESSPREHEQKNNEHVQENGKGDQADVQDQKEQRNSEEEHTV